MKNKPFFKSDDHVRSFGGKLTDFESKEERAFEKRHLTAYLKGKKTFNFGYHTVPTDFGDTRMPKKFPVQEIWTPKTQINNETATGI